MRRRSPSEAVGDVGGVIASEGESEDVCVLVGIHDTRVDGPNVLALGAPTSGPSDSTKVQGRTRSVTGSLAPPIREHTQVHLPLRTVLDGAAARVLNARHGVPQSTDTATLQLMHSR